MSTYLKYILCSPYKLFLIPSDKRSPRCKKIRSPKRKVTEFRASSICKKPLIFTIAIKSKTWEATSTMNERKFRFPLNNCFIFAGIELSSQYITLVTASDLLIWKGSMRNNMRKAWSKLNMTYACTVVTSAVLSYFTGVLCHHKYVGVCRTRHDGRSCIEFCQNFAQVYASQQDLCTNCFQLGKNRFLSCLNALKSPITFQKHHSWW